MMSKQAYITYTSSEQTKKLKLKKYTTETTCVSIIFNKRRYTS